MDRRVFRRVQRYGWDAATNAYDRGWVPLIEGLTESCVARAALQPGARVLDLATGTGVGAFAASLAVGGGGSGGSVTGIDVSHKMVTLASLRAANGGLRNVVFQRNDMEATGAPDGAFDAVTCAFGLMFAADRAAAFAEIARVTRPGGRVSVCVWGPRAACGFAEVFPIVDARVETDVCPLFFSLGVPGALTASFEAAGLTDVVEESVRVTLSWASADEACRAMLEGGAVALAWNRFDAETRAVVRAEYLASLEPFRRGDRYDVPAEVRFATARKASSGARRQK
jgi:SAM-dependent methyltransferase